MLEPNHRRTVPGDLELKAQSVTVEHDIAIVVLTRGGAPVEYPLKYHPRLMKAPHEQRSHVEISNDKTSVNWPDIGLTLSITAMFKAAGH